MRYSQLYTAADSVGWQLSICNVTIRLEKLSSSVRGDVNVVSQVNVDLCSIQPMVRSTRETKRHPPVLLSLAQLVV